MPQAWMLSFTEKKSKCFLAWICLCRSILILAILISQLILSERRTLRTVFEQNSCKSLPKLPLLKNAQSRLSFWMLIAYTCGLFMSAAKITSLMSLIGNCSRVCVCSPSCNHSHRMTFMTLFTHHGLPLAWVWWHRLSLSDSITWKTKAAFRSVLFTFFQVYSFDTCEQRY